MKAGWPIIGAGLLLTAAPEAAWAQRADNAAAAQAPLGEALEQFGRRSGFDIVFPESLVAGLRAGPVDIAATPHRQLDQLLRGTGLAARFTRPDAIVLEPTHTASAPNMTLDRIEAHASIGTGPAAYQWYGQHLLDKSLNALRHSSELMRKPYSLIVYLWVDTAGQVTEARVRGVDGTEREASIAASMLNKLMLDLPPPLNMPQPVALRIGSH